MILSRTEMADKVATRLLEAQDDLKDQWKSSAPINHFVLDEVFPKDWVHRIRSAFPPEGAMVLKRSLREVKLIAAQMDRYDPILEEAIYAFQAPAIIEIIHQITGLDDLEPDEQLYAGGISAMARGHFLNPHIDNSHDKYRQRYRVINLLFYVSPDWTESRGCNLELWPTGPRGKPVTITSQFNRLVAMVTHRASWHSVSRNLSNETRCCVSNYYFSQVPVEGVKHFHVTSFRGRPEQPVRDLVLRTDKWLRTTIRKAFPLGVRDNPHYYAKNRDRT